MTGVVLHTNLGWGGAPRGGRALAAAARGYCVLASTALRAAQRARRPAGRAARPGDGAETGIAVNNCAAAAFLMMQTFAGGREAVVSRGNLVEIGGSFRVP